MGRISAAICTMRTNNEVRRVAGEFQFKTEKRRIGAFASQGEAGSTLSLRVCSAFLQMPLGTHLPEHNHAKNAPRITRLSGPQTSKGRSLMAILFRRLFRAFLCILLLAAFPTCATLDELIRPGWPLYQAYDGEPKQLEDVAIIFENSPVYIDNIDGRKRSDIKLRIFKYLEREIQGMAEWDVDPGIHSITADYHATTREYTEYGAPITISYNLEKGHIYKLIYAAGDNTWTINLIPLGSIRYFVCSSDFKTPSYPSHWAAYADLACRRSAE
jgi:hypothetical protein